MNWVPTAVRCLGISVLVLAQAAFSNVSPSCAETYIAGQLGVTLPSVLPSAFDNGLTNGTLTGVAGAIVPGGTISDQALQRSILYGGKIGHYFKTAPWLGLEAEVYNTTPHIKQQTVIVSDSSGPISQAELPGVNFRVLTVAPFNVIVRYHKTRLQPYLGAGPAIFFSRIKDPSMTANNEQSSTAFGVNAFVGIRYYITRQLTVFGEGKFNHARFKFEETPPASNPSMFGFDATYNIFHAAFGLSYHF